MKIRPAKQGKPVMKCSDIEQGKVFRFTDDLDSTHMRTDDGFAQLDDGQHYGIGAFENDEVILVNGYFQEE